jgi:hypothetical protein
MTVEGDTLIRANSARVCIRDNDTYIRVQNNPLQDYISGVGQEFVNLMQDKIVIYGGH